MAEKVCNGDDSKAGSESEKICCFFCAYFYLLIGWTAVSAGFVGKEIKQIAKLLFLCFMAEYGKKGMQEIGGRLSDGGARI
ncbi:MAG: hypothetical protein Q4C60_00845 [Eubacteriales bacterium]|nr:hypothetical protein [Eubacteriales bacterium]